MTFVRLYLKLKFAWRLFGRQFLVVAERQQSEAIEPQEEEAANRVYSRS